MRPLLLSLPFIASLMLPLAAGAADINAGFVQGLWYSKEPIFSGETVRVYAALRNNTESDMTGTVTFRDGSRVIARKEFSALSGRLIETWADWTPAYGEHTLSATLSDVRLERVGEEPQKVAVTSAETERFTFIDHDTDDDGIGNEDDTDDDNDGISDEDEEENGTDPLVPNEDDATDEETDENTEENENASETETSEQETESGGDTSASNEPRSGFETYFDDGTVNTVLSNVTERINTSKERLDTYRTARNEAREAKKAQDREEATSTATSTDSEGETATITRTQLEGQNQGLFATLIAGIVSIMDGLYTLLLWILSKTLAYPGLVQFLLLVAILYSVYKTARWYGNRQQQ